MIMMSPHPKEEYSKMCTAAAAGPPSLIPTQVRRSQYIKKYLKMSQLTESDIMELLGQTTPTTVSACIPKEAKEQHQNSDDPIPSNWPFDINPIGSLNGKVEVLTRKVAALEVNKCQ
jgi:hypothetical protein